MMRHIAVLLLEANPQEVENLQATLRAGDVDAHIDPVATAADFDSALRSRPYDLILGDFTLPGLAGPMALQVARQIAPSTPVISLSAPLAEGTHVGKTEYAATDYVVNRRPERLIAAVQRALTEADERAERIRAQAALRESQELFRLIVESAREYAIFTLDLGCHITSWNAGAQRMLGFEESEVLGQDVSIIYTPADRTRGLARTEMEQALATGRGGDDHWHLRKDGSTFWASGMMMPLRDDRGAVRGILKILRDMTEHKRLEDTLRDANRRKDEFLAVLAHELRNPLAPVRSALHLLRYQAHDLDTVHAMRDLMDRQLGHLTHLLNDLLEVSRLTRGKIVLHPERLDLNRQVGQSVADHRPRFEDAGLTLDLNVSETPVWVSADATRLSQMMDNLLDNAAKFTERGGKVTGTVYADTVGKEGIIRVRDTGIGIEPPLVPLLFETLAQGDRSLDRKQGGLGLGLALVKGLAALHGGSVSAASEGVGRGAEFTIRLPLESESPALLEKPVTATPALKHLRILVVEDNRDAANTLKMMLTMFGYEVTVAYTGTAGVQAAHDSHPDVVLCDIGLPGMDGFAVASALRRDPVTADARLIAVTGYGQEADRRRALEAGFDEHLTKPVDPQRLLGQIDPGI